MLFSMRRIGNWYNQKSFKTANSLSRYIYEFNLFLRMKLKYLMLNNFTQIRTNIRWTKPLLVLILMVAFYGCSEKIVYHGYATYTLGTDGNCAPADHEHQGKIVINTGLKYIKAGTPDNQQKFRIKSFSYIYNTFEFNTALRSKKSITVECANGYQIYIEYGSFGILTLPDDGDEDKCDNSLFYNL